MAPVTEGFSTKGYLMIHSPVSGIEERCRPIMVPVYITLAAIFVLSLIFLLGFHFSSTVRCGSSPKRRGSMPPET